MNPTGQAAYCSIDDVRERLYGGVSATPISPNATSRDSLLENLIYQVSRRFEDETSRPLNGFAPSYEARLYSGRGMQLLDIDHAAAIRKIEWNSTPTGAPSWNDISSEMGTASIVIRPIRFWPKRQLFRQATWIVDPWQAGNYRLTGIWGSIQPDLSQNPPVGMSGGGWYGLTDTQIYAMAPNPPPTVPPPAGWTPGWWVTPHQVRGGVADWVVHRYNRSRAGQSSGASPAPPNRGASQVLGDIPPDVQRIITLLKGSRLQLALIGIDGSDAKEDFAAAMGGYDPAHRWAGWHWFDPNTGQSW